MNNQFLLEEAYIEIEPCNLAVMVTWLRQLNAKTDDAQADYHVFLCRDGSWEIRALNPEVPDPSPYLAALGTVSYVLEETADLPDMDTTEVSWHGLSRYYFDTNLPE